MLKLFYHSLVFSLNVSPTGLTKLFEANGSVGEILEQGFRQLVLPNLEATLASPALPGQLPDTDQVEINPFARG